ncbi:legumin1 [Zea mays]|uniref:Legumin1 n=1 Tax=Zea mays TaxID=4577 RepID=A0A1D6LHZ7_MAIZE|nr:legumin1 [Zea mays]
MASWRPWSRATRCSLRPAPSSTSAGSTKPTGSSPAPASSPSASSSTPWASCSLDTPTSIRLSTSSKGEGSLGSRFRDAKRRPSSSSMDTDMDMDTITISMTTTRSTDAQGEGFQYIAFETNPDTMVSHVAGKNSVLSDLPAAVIASSYAISMEEAAELKNGRKHELAVLTPAGSGSYQQGQAGSAQQ